MLLSQAMNSNTAYGCVRCMDVSVTRLDFNLFIAISVYYLIYTRTHAYCLERIFARWMELDLSMRAIRLDQQQALQTVYRHRQRETVHSLLVLHEGFAPRHTQTLHFSVGRRPRRQARHVYTRQTTSDDSLPDTNNLI